MDVSDSLPCDVGALGDPAFTVFRELQTDRVSADRWPGYLHADLEGNRPALRVSHYRNRSISQCAEEANTPLNVFAVSIMLSAAPLSMSVDDRPVHDGPILPGMIHICPPGSRRSWTFQMPVDLMQVHVDCRLLAGLTTLMPPAHGQLRLTCPSFKRDEGLEQVARSILEIDPLRGRASQAVLNSLGIGLLARLVLCHSTYRHGSANRKPAELPNWRFGRVSRYLTDHLAHMVSLEEMAYVSGLSPSYFAAAFRRKLGVRPHEYFLHMKIMRAQELLVSSPLTILDISKSLGFASQSHFATVFRRCTGESPAVWRKLLSE